MKEDAMSKIKDREMRSKSAEQSKTKSSRKIRRQKDDMSDAKSLFFFQRL